MSQGALQGKVVLVTGATGNVGWGAAHAALAAGARVALTARSERARAALEEELGGDRVLVAVVDHADLDSLTAFRDEVVRRFGALDHVAAPMGAWWQKGPSLDQPPGELRALLATCVEAQWLLLKATAPALRASGGSYTLVSGTGGERLIPGAGLLVTAVSAQFALSRVLRAECAKEAFRFNELRISARVEREPRAGVVPSRVAGEAFVEIMVGETRGAGLRYAGPGRLARMEG